MIMRSTNNSILIKHAYYKRRARAIIANVSLIAIVLCICIMMLLYGNTNSKKSATRVYIDNYLDSSDTDELKYFLNFIATSKKLLKKEVDKQVASILDKKRS